MKPFLSKTNKHFIAIVTINIEINKKMTQFLFHIHNRTRIHSPFAHHVFFISIDPFALSNNIISHKSWMNYLAIYSFIQTRVFFYHVFVSCVILFFKINGHNIFIVNINNLCNRFSKVREKKWLIPGLWCTNIIKFHYFMIDWYQKIDETFYVKSYHCQSNQSAKE